MKKYCVCLSVIFLALCLFSGCSGGGERIISQKTQPDTSAGQALNAAISFDSYPENPEIEKTSATPDVDVDLTALSSTMVYAEVYNIMMQPDQYLGKTIKVSGQYYSDYYDRTEKYYHFVLIDDAAACCQQGLEFSLIGESVYPDDYPKTDATIQIVGTFDRYDEFDNTYYYISVECIDAFETSSGD